MYRRILFKRDLSLSERVKRVIIYFRIRRGTVIAWRRRHEKVIRLNSHLGKKVLRSIEKEHKKYWQPLTSRLNINTLRICGNLSGISEYRFIPEEVFKADIEPSLNRDAFPNFYSHKSYYDLWCPRGVFPISYLHNLDGIWLDTSLNQISFDQVREIVNSIPYPVVVKPNKDSHGGKNVNFIYNARDLLTYIEPLKNILIQEKIKQYDYFNQFNSNGINSLRVYVYRSVINNQFHVVNIALRMGMGGSLDNETAGGIVTLVKMDGYLNGYAVDKYGSKYFSHPDTGIKFDSKIPDLPGLIEKALYVAGKIFYAKLIGFDMCYDDQKNWRMLEVNLDSATIRFAQYHGSLIFSEFTEEVRDYCITNHWILR